jgi:hypothetical protein
VIAEKISGKVFSPCNPKIVHVKTRCFVINGEESEEYMYLLPNPQSIQYLNQNFLIAYKGKIIIDTNCSNAIYHYATILKKDLLENLGFALSITKGDAENGGIYLSENPSLQQEEYTLDITSERITIQGGNDSAILYGIQTLRQIISQEGAVLPCVIIRDYPEIKNRGYYFDVTRGRIPTLDYLKAFADKLSYYKINQLQLYVEHSYLFKGLSEVWRDDTPLTAEEILELDAYCSNINIELVPSLSSFGHLCKLLSTKTYSHLCELPNSEQAIFSYKDRMDHHTIDVTNQESLSLIKSLIEEYLPLFRSKHFNICADETFDLGKGRSKHLADSIGLNAMYVEYVKELCLFLIEKGKRPMFWGDIVCGFPEAFKQLPKETICLNWGYASNQSEETTKTFHEVGATQYVCPGVGGWNQFINILESSYENISRMCSYAHKYQAIGVLNTDWGDFGHINHPEFSTTGMIYGAAFSWNRDILPFKEINKQISYLEYGDHSESFVDLVAKISTKSNFEWYHIVCYMEMGVRGNQIKEMGELFSDLDLSIAKKVNEELQVGLLKLYEVMKHMDIRRRALVKPYLVFAEGMKLFNSIGATISNLLYDIPNDEAKNPMKLAVDLEYWFYSYKDIWRQVSKESELFRLQNIVIWYADFLRDLKN